MGDFGNTIILNEVKEKLMTNGHSMKNGIKPPILGNTYEETEETVAYLKKRTEHRPEIAIICGTGFGGVADALIDTDVFEYRDVPHFSVSTAPGHKGKLVFGRISGKTVLCMQGRTHAYEGYPPQKIVFPIRVMKLFGIKTLIVTNASGGLNPDFEVGDVMLIKDHINLPGLCGQNPLVGPNDERFGPRFPAMSQAYTKELRTLAKTVGRELGLKFIREGVYIVQSGPCYESVAECIMFKNMGADVTGMSTVPEITVAVQCGMRTLGMSLVTNKCVMELDSKDKANQEEVMETARTRIGDIKKYISKILEHL